MLECVGLLGRPLPGTPVVLTVFGLGPCCPLVPYTLKPCPIPTELSLCPTTPEGPGGRGSNLRIWISLLLEIRCDIRTA